MNRRFSARAFAAALSLIVIHGSAQSVRAVGASGDTTRPSQETLHPFFAGGFQITENVAFDPAAGPWLKRLINGGQSHNSGQNVPIIETFTNTGTLAWTDWHEEVRSRTQIPGGPGDEPGFLFREGSVSIAADFGGGFVPLADGVDYTLVPTLYSGVPEPGNNFNWEAVSVFFAPNRLIAPGNRLRIEKSIFEVFGDADPWRPQEEAILAQYPTVPEPSSALLAVVGVLVAGFRRKVL